MEEDKLPTFPDLPLPDTITTGEFYVIEDGDIKSEEDLSELIKEMYKKPDASFRYYSKNGNALIAEAIDKGIIRSNVIESYYYQHPKFERNYIKINKGREHYEWQREVADKQPMFFRRLLSLTETQIKRMDREIDLEYARARRTWTEKVQNHPYFFGFVLITTLIGLALAISPYLK